MKRLLPPGCMIFAGILGIAAASLQADQDMTKHRRKFDLREAVLRKFLKERQCPVHDYAGVFIAEADANGLDWRLLPSLAMVESGGGKHAPGNNLFGWGKSRFASIGDAIHHVASVLSSGKPYRGKDLDAKLATYNSVRTDYKAMVTQIMREISPTPQVQVTALE